MSQPAPGTPPSEASTTSVLRSSCDPCYSSKLRCSRNKPTCIRCQKNGTSCVYTPPKRPGRPRKLVATISRALESNSQATRLRRKSSNSSARELIVASGDEVRPGLVTSISIDNTTQPSSYLFGPVHALGTGDAMDESAILHSVFGPPLNIMDFINTESAEADLSGIDISPSFCPAVATMDEISLTPRAYQELEYNSNSTNDVDPPASDLRATETPTCLNMDQFDEAPHSGWLPDAARFSEECTSLQYWASRTSSVMLSNDNFASDLYVTGQCLCHVANMNLQFHRQSAKKSQTEAALEACLHLQRLLHLSWDRQSQCLTCQGDILGKLMYESIFFCPSPTTHASTLPTPCQHTANTPIAG